MAGPAAGGRALSRRSVLGLAAAAGTVAGLSGLLSCAASAASAAPSARSLLDAPRFFVAHRGSGEEAPEHTLAAYTRSTDRGAAAVEVSVRRTADGVLVCHHDETLERTCAGAPGAVAELTARQLERVSVDMTALVGPAWGTQPIPRLAEVLDRIGGRTVLFLEAKDAAAEEALLAEIVSRGLERSVVWKQHFGRDGDRAARRAGLAVWNYYDREATAADVAGLADRSDAIGAVVSDPLGPHERELLRAAVGTGRPVIAWAVRRRGQVEELAALGVRGFMASSWSYLALPPIGNGQDGFPTLLAQPGDLTADGRPRWEDGGLRLSNGAPQQSIVMGSMGPVSAPDYRLSFEMCANRVPADPDAHFGAVVERPDDRPYRFRADGPSGGLLVVLRMRGRIEVRAIPLDNGESVELAGATGRPVVAGGWEKIDVDLGPRSVSVRRHSPDGSGVTLTCPRPAPFGPYFGFTRNYPGQEGSVGFRAVRVTT